MVDRVNDFAQLAYLVLRDDAVEDLLLAAQHALAIHDGDGAAHAAVDLLANLRGVVRDDEGRLDLVHLGLDHVEHLRRDEVGEQRVERAVDAKEYAGHTVDDDVHAEDHLPHGEVGLSADEDGHGLGAVEAAAPADHDAHAKAEKHAAKANREQGLAGGVRPAVEELDARGERRHREDGARGKAAAELDAAQDDEGCVQDNREQGEGNARYVREHHAHADDTAVQDGVGNEELLHGEGRDGGTKGEERVVDDGMGGTSIHVGCLSVS